MKAFDSPKRLPISFSTLGCPKWDWKTILNRAAEWGYAAIELRGIQGEMDLTRRREFSPAGLSQSMRELEDLHLRISDLGASARMHDIEPARRKAQLDEARSFIDLAHRLNAPYVRVFGNNIVEGQSRQATIDRIVAGLRELGEYAKGSGVGVLLESHGDFADSPTLHEILAGVAMPNVGLLWDTHHTFVIGKEPPATTFARLGSYISHTHIKDSIGEGTNLHYVLPGKGRIPIREIAETLEKGGYRGYYGFEWEKAWHPEIEEPEIAFPLYARLLHSF